MKKTIEKPRRLLSFDNKALCPKAAHVRLQNTERSDSGHTVSIHQIVTGSQGSRGIRYTLSP